MGEGGIEKTRENVAAVIAYQNKVGADSGGEFPELGDRIVGLGLCQAESESRIGCPAVMKKVGDCRRLA